MIKCNQCGTAMKPLFNSVFCPKDCDRDRAVDSSRDLSVYSFYDRRMVPWLAQRVLANSPAPSWARYQWFLFDKTRSASIHEMEDRSKSTKFIVEQILQTDGNIVDMARCHPVSTDDRIVFGC